MTTQNLRALVALDLDTSSVLNRAWAKGLLSFFHSGGVSTDFLSRNPELGEFEESIAPLCESVIPAHLHVDAESMDRNGVAPRYRARQIVALANTNNYDFVLVQGLWLGRYVAGGKSLQTKLWTICDDFPYLDSTLSPKDLKHIEVVATGSKLLLTGSSNRRSKIESMTPKATSKTRLLPSFHLGLELHDPLDNSPTAPAGILYDTVVGLDALSSIDFRSIAYEAMPLKHPPRITLASVNDPKSPELQETLRKTGLIDYPGLQLCAEPAVYCDYVEDSTLLLTPSGLTNPASSYFAQLSKTMGLTRWWPKSPKPKLSDLYAPQSPIKSNKTDFVSTPWYEVFQNDIADYARVPRKERPTKVLLAGADFKFAGDLVDSLIQRADIDLCVDLFEANAKPQPEKSSALLPWADVVIAEFASYNAIWYSQNLLPHQKLIVHLHGYELLQPWIDELVLENCDKIVFASNFYMQKAIDMKGWPKEKLHVISNSVNFADLDRTKVKEARFHIGLIGIVPILKRPDRAISLLTRLLTSDSRYVLHIKGHVPWDYAWEWKKAAHQDSYRAFYASIANNPDIFSRIVFEPFSPDIGNWMQKIGWMLSPSYRETFHLSAIEGAASGAIPLAWNREGSEEIIGADYNFADTNSVAEFIISTNRSPEAYALVSAEAKESVKRYDIPEVRAKWLNLIFGLASEKTSFSKREITVPPHEQRVIDEVLTAAHHRDFDGALGILDDNIPITRDSTSPLKHVEMYFRGLLALDESRFNRFLPTTAKGTEFPQPQQLLLVRGPGPAPESAIRSGLVRYETLIDISTFPAAEQGREAASQQADADAISLSSRLHIPRQIRFDRGIHFAKSQIVLDAVQQRLTAIVAMGPWWIALPALLAADQLGLRCAWIIDDAGVWDDIELAKNQDQTNNYIAHTVKSLFYRADVRLATEASLTANAPIEDVSACITKGEPHSSGIRSLSWNELPEFLTDSSSSSSSNPELGEPETTSTDVSIFVISSSSFFSRVQKLYPNAERLEPEDLLKPVSPLSDAVVVHDSVFEEDDWKESLTPVEPEQSIAINSFFDRCRVSGVPSIFIHSDDSAISYEEINVARKADNVCSPRPDNLTDLLKLHPISVKSVHPWMEAVSLDLALSSALRGAGVPVKGSHERRTTNENALDEFSESRTSQELDSESQFVPLFDSTNDSITVYFPSSQKPYVHDFLKIQGMPDNWVILKPVSDSNVTTSAELSSAVLQAALASDSKGYVCALSSLQDAPAQILRKLWVNASPEVIVRLSGVGQALLNSEKNVRSLKLGDLFSPGNINGNPEVKLTFRLVE